MARRRVLFNAVMLYGMTAAKIVLPLLTLPYLTRVLSKDCYGVVAYVKSIMCFAQVLIDFGFMLSATKDIALAGKEKNRVNAILGDVLAARLMLSALAAAGMFVAAVSIPMLRPYVLFTMLNFVVVFLTVFLFDFFFRGIEEMSVITSRYVLMRSISVALTFLFVKSDADILMLPVLEIVGSLAAIVFVLHEIHRRGYACAFTGVSAAWQKLRCSAIYFASNAATTTFNALTTLIIGIYLPPDQVADWSICLQMVMVVQMFYNPVADSLYPHMVKRRDLAFSLKLIGIFSMLVVLGGVFTWFGAAFSLTLIGGAKYTSAVPLLRAFIPLLLFSFLAIMFGWPMLGAIGGERETTVSTVFAGFVQVLGLGVLLMFDAFGVVALALLRGGTDLLLFALRGGFFFLKWRGINEFELKARCLHYAH